MGCGASSQPEAEAATDAPKAATADPSGAPKAAGTESVPAAPPASETRVVPIANAPPAVSSQEAAPQDPQVAELFKKIDDSSRDALEAVFQGMDEDHNKDVDESEFQRWMGQVKAGQGASYRPAIKAAGEGGEQLAIEAS